MYTYPSKKSLDSVIDKVRTITRDQRHETLAAPATSAQSDTAGMVQLLPSRVVVTDFGYI